MKAIVVSGCEDPFFDTDNATRWTDECVNEFGEHQMGGTGGQRNSIAQRLRRERLVSPAAEPFHKRAPDERPNTGSILIVTLLLIARAVGGDLGRRQNIGFGPARIVKVDYRASGQVHCDTPRAMGSWERPTARYLG